LPSYKQALGGVGCIFQLIMFMLATMGNDFRERRGWWERKKEKG
jgi:hypothetical protein